MDIYEQIVRRAPSPVPKEPKVWKLVYLARLLYADLLRDKERYTEAIALAEEAALEPRLHLPAYTIIGSCYADCSEHERAVEAYLHALEHQPLKSVHAWVFLSYSLELCGRHEESDFCLYAALQIDPNYDEAHFNLGASARDRGDMEEAEWRFRRALKEAPDYDRAQAELGRLILERAEPESEELAEAEHHLRTAVELAPEEVRARLYLAQLHWARGHIDEADREFRAAVDLRPDWTTTHYLYGHFLECGLNDDQLAEYQYCKALELDPLNLPALFSVVHFLEKQKRYGEASKFRQRVKTIAEDMTRAYLGPVVEDGGSLGG